MLLSESKCLGFSPLLVSAWLLSSPIAASEPLNDYFSLSLEELANIKVVTSSRREQLIEESHANISVITKESIERRGYRNIIQVLQDLPGFDFATYEDGGGEYPAHFLNRGIGGDNGNTRLLVMIDGFVQNHISFNWAQTLNDEQMLIDIERIEIVQGPGSSLYGAQAVSGIVHIITKKNFKGSHSKLTLGENNTRSMELLLGHAIGDTHLQLALKHYKSDGDQGKGRPDPGGYFSANVHPNILVANYDENGNYLTNVANPLAGLPIPDGFNNSKDDSAVRFKITTKQLQLGINYWQRKDGLGSYVAGYDYDATADDFIAHHDSFTVYMKNQSSIFNDEINWKSDLWYREDAQREDTGFRYLYRFNQLRKTYHSTSSQIGFENQFDWKIDTDKTFTFGTRFLGLRQTDQVISLGQEQNGNASTTQSSWDIAAAGGGLYQEKVNEIFDESENAIYALLEGEFSPKLSYSLGTRYSNGSDYGSTNTPRLGLIYRWDNDWLIKTLYGSAFRQPSLFELHDEFRGSEELKPEKIDTYEIELNKKLASLGQIKFNLFYSNLNDSISLITDSSRTGDQRYANVSSSKAKGISAQADLRPLDNLSFYANYMYQQGTDINGNWGALAHTAEHKLNLGLNWQPLGSHFNINLRANHVGKRATPVTNLFFDDDGILDDNEGEAPAYTKFDLVLTLVDLFQQKGLSSQLTVNNLFDESYFGVGRQSGSAPDSVRRINNMPSGFIPAYHPQPRRSIYLTLSYQL